MTITSIYDNLAWHLNFFTQKVKIDTYSVPFFVSQNHALQECILQVTLVTYVVQNTSLEMVVSEMYPLQKENAGEMTAQILFT